MITKLFKTPNPIKEFAKKVKRQSLPSKIGTVDKRRSTTICDSDMLDEDFLAKLRSIPDADESGMSVETLQVPTHLCHSCKEGKNSQRLIMCRECDIMFHPSCVRLLDNTTAEVIEYSKCPGCNMQMRISEIMFVYAENCETSHIDILKNDMTIKELEEQLEQVQKEVMFYKSNVNQLSRQRDVSKRIMATLVTMIS